MCDDIEHQITTQVRLFGIYSVGDAIGGSFGTLNIVTEETARLFDTEAASGWAYPVEFVLNRIDQKSVDLELGSGLSQ